MKRFLSAVFAVALGLALSTAASADTVGQKVDRGVDKTKDAAENTKDAAKDSGETMKDKTKSTMEKVKEKTRDMKDRVMGHKAEGPEDHHGTSMKKHDDVMAMQQALKDKGHDPGAIDGKMGPRTRTALKEYQQAEGLKATGRLDSETRAKLGMATASTSSTIPSASPATSSPSSTAGDTNATTTTTTNPAPGNPTPPSTKKQEP
jgi:peptidoglycan hydrolase-like protein with peptidoglycan-binding domain